MSDEMQYTAKLLELAHTLDGYRATLLQQSNNLQAADAKLRTAWSSEGGETNQAFADYKVEKDRWDDEFGTEDMANPQATIKKLDNLGNAIVAAYERATSTDIKVGAAFSGGGKI